MEATLRSYAQSALIEAKGDRSRAAEILSERIKSEKEVYAELMEPFFSRAVWQEISVAASALRMGYWKEAPAAGDASGLDVIAKRNASSILDEWFLSSGKPLGDATKDDLAHEAALHERLAASNANRAQFYRAIIKRMGKSADSVRSAMSAAVVEALKSEIPHE